jgi:hypothetical protein
VTLTLITGLAMTAVTLTFAGRRAAYLYRLITSGQPAPDRVEGVTGRVGRAVQTQLVEVNASSSSGPSPGRHTSSSSGRS